MSTMTITPGQRQDAADLAEQAEVASKAPIAVALFDRVTAVLPKFAADSIDRCTAERLGSSLAGMVMNGDDLHDEEIAEWTAAVERLEAHLVPDEVSRFIARAAVDAIEARS